MTRMNRVEFQTLATERLSDAEALIKAARYACAYYVAGYAVECALKACIARKTNQDDFPPKDAQRYYLHDISKLLDGAGPGLAFEQEAAQDPIFRANWATVKDWTEEARYQRHAQRQAEEIMSAIIDPDHGVLQWLRRNW